jgi:hypothetical protein
MLAADLFLSSISSDHISSAYEQLGCQSCSNPTLEVKRRLGVGIAVAYLPRQLQMQIVELIGLASTSRQ